MPVHSTEVGHKAYIFTHTDHHKKPNELRERGVGRSDLRRDHREWIRWLERMKWSVWWNERDSHHSGNIINEIKKL